MADTDIDFPGTGTGTGLPTPTAIGQILYAADLTEFVPVLPLINDDEALLIFSDDALLVVEG